MIVESETLCYIVSTYRHILKVVQVSHWVYKQAVAKAGGREKQTTLVVREPPCF